MALLAGPSASGRWVAVAGMPEFGVEAADRFGIALERLVLVPDPGRQWLTVVAALADVIPVVAVRPVGRVAPAESSPAAGAAPPARHHAARRGRVAGQRRPARGRGERVAGARARARPARRPRGRRERGRPRRVRASRQVAAAAARSLAGVRPGRRAPPPTWRSRSASTTSSGGPPDERRPRPHHRAVVPRLADLRRVPRERARPGRAHRPHRAAVSCSPAPPPRAATASPAG